jgi:hypothetical protein
MYVCIKGNGNCFEPDEGDVPYEEGVANADFVEYFSERYGKTFVARQVEPSVGVPNQRSIGFEMVRRARETAFIFRMIRTYIGEFGGTPNSIDNLTADERTRLAALGYTIPTDGARLGEELERIDGWLRDQESFFFQLIQLQSQFGIGSYLGF